VAVARTQLPPWTARVQTPVPPTPQSTRTSTHITIRPPPAQGMARRERAKESTENAINIMKREASALEEPAQGACPASIRSSTRQRRSSGEPPRPRPHPGRGNKTLSRGPEVRASEARDPQAPRLFPGDRSACSCCRLGRGRLQSFSTSGCDLPSSSGETPFPVNGLVHHAATAVRRPGQGRAHSPGRAGRLDRGAGSSSEDGHAGRAGLDIDQKVQAPDPPRTPRALLRPKDRLRPMFVELDPGTAGAAQMQKGRQIPGADTARTSPRTRYSARSNQRYAGGTF